MTVLLWNEKHAKLRVDNTGCSGGVSGHDFLTASDFGTVLELVEEDGSVPEKIVEEAWPPPPPPPGMAVLACVSEWADEDGASSKKGVAAARTEGVVVGGEVPSGGGKWWGGTEKSRAEDEKIVTTISTSERREHFLELERQRQRQKMKKSDQPPLRLFSAPVYGAAALATSGQKSEVARAAAPLATTTPDQQAPPAQATVPAPGVARVVPRQQVPPLPVPNLFDRGQCEGRRVRFLVKKYGFQAGQETVLRWHVKGGRGRCAVRKEDGYRAQGGRILEEKDFDENGVLEMLEGFGAEGAAVSASGPQVEAAPVYGAAAHGPQVEAAPVYGAAALARPKSEVAAAPLAATGQQAPLAQVAPGPAPLPAPKILPRIQQPPLPVPNLFDRGQCEGRRVRFLVTKYGFQAGQETVLRWHEKGGRARVEKNGYRAQGGRILEEKDFDERIIGGGVLEMLEGFGALGGDAAVSATGAARSAGNPNAWTRSASVGGTWWGPGVWAPAAPAPPQWAGVPPLGGMIPAHGADAIHANAMMGWSPMAMAWMASADGSSYGGSAYGSGWGAAAGASQGGSGR